MWKHLTLQDRETIEIQLWRWSRQREIAKVLKRSDKSKHISHENIYKWLEQPAQYKYRSNLLYNEDEYWNIWEWTQ